MKKIALSSLLASASLLVTSLAQAQNCPPGSWLCADVQIGGGIGGGVVIGGGRPVPPPAPLPPPPPPPAPPVVVYQPAPVYVQPPPPPPQPVLIVRQAPVYYTTTTYAPAPVTPDRPQTLGLGAYASGLFMSRDEGSRGAAAMGGGGVMMRYRHTPHLASEATLAGMFGTDYNGDARAEIPVTVGGVVYFNPRNRFQVYGLLGAGMSFASLRYDHDNARDRGRDEAAYTYIGGYAGLGAEWQLSRNFSLLFDVRGFVRGRVDRDVRTNPEFTRLNGTHVETTNVSMGMTGQLGAMFWF